MRCGRSRRLLKKDPMATLHRFHRDPVEPQVRTADIFCEEEFQDLRDRFQSFASDTLVAFLRSTLP